MPTDIGEARNTASRESRRRCPLLHPIPLPMSTAVFCFDWITDNFAPLGDEVVTLLDQQDADVRLRPYWNSSSECRRYTLRRGEGGGRP